jgi:TnpA family transposase
MYDDAMKRAQACLVNYQHKQSLPSLWGNATTSSSDGMRIQVGVSSLEAEHYPYYGSKKGTTLYRFVSDHYSLITFSTKKPLYLSLYSKNKMQHMDGGKDG